VLLLTLKKQRALSLGVVEQNLLSPSASSSVPPAFRPANIKVNWQRPTRNKEQLPKDWVGLEEEALELQSTTVAHTSPFTWRCSS
jgi:hypothetical protein